MSQHDDPDQHDVPTPSEVMNRAGAFQTWLDSRGLGKPRPELDNERIQKALADHEREMHGVESPEPIAQDCLEDVKRRYDLG